MVGHFFGQGTLSKNFILDKPSRYGYAIECPFFVSRRQLLKSNLLTKDNGASKERCQLHI